MSFLVQTIADVIRLRLQGNPNLPFAVSPLEVTNEGPVDIMVAGRLDFETEPMYQFMVSKFSLPWENFVVTDIFMFFLSHILRLIYKVKWKVCRLFLA